MFRHLENVSAISPYEAPPGNLRMDICEFGRLAKENSDTVHFNHSSDSFSQKSRSSSRRSSSDRSARAQNHPPVQPPKKKLLIKDDFEDLIVPEEPVRRRPTPFLAGQPEFFGMQVEAGALDTRPVEHRNVELVTPESNFKNQHDTTRAVEKNADRGADKDTEKGVHRPDRETERGVESHGHHKSKSKEKDYLAMLTHDFDRQKKLVREENIGSDDEPPGLIKRSVLDDILKKKNKAGENDGKESQDFSSIFRKRVKGAKDKK